MSLLRSSQTADNEAQEHQQWQLQGGLDEQQARQEAQAHRRRQIFGFVLLAWLLAAVVGSQWPKDSVQPSLSLSNGATNPIQANDSTLITTQGTECTGAADAIALAAAEKGQLRYPALVWFYADWCSICQSIKPTVSDLEIQYADTVKIIRINVDYSSSSQALRKYRVRGTPSFVLFDHKGKVVAQTAGWPGREAITKASDQLIAQN